MRTPPLPERVIIREVGPRDGLQAEAPVSPARRADLALALVASGLRRIEAASFVSPKAVPSMAGAQEVIDVLRERLAGAPGEPVVIAALVPNLRGANDALDAGVDELTVTVAASPTYNARNVRRTIDESVEDIVRITDAATERGVPVDVVISCAFGSPYEGAIDPHVVAELALRLRGGNGRGRGTGGTTSSRASSVTAVTLADTTGMATPLSIAAVLSALEAVWPELQPGLHLHETRGTAMANAYAGLTMGVTRFDTAVGGLGGSPFADGAGGNLATEDFVSFLDAMGIDCGIDLAALLDAAALATELAGHELASAIRARSVPTR